MNILKKIQPTFIVLTVFLMSALPDSQAFELSAIGGVNYGAPSQRTSGIDYHWTGSTGAGFGLLAAVNLFDSSFDFESGAIWLTSRSDRETFPVITWEQNWVQVPFVIRYNFDQNFALGIGGYAAFANGNMEQTITGITPMSFAYESVGLKKTDGGLLLNVRAKFAISPPFYLIIDARYQHGFANLAINPADLYSTRALQAFAGLTFVFESAASEEPQVTNPYGIGNL